jgi:hypothetical protein
MPSIGNRDDFVICFNWLRQEYAINININFTKTYVNSDISG